MIEVPDSGGHFVDQIFRSSPAQTYAVYDHSQTSFLFDLTREDIKLHLRIKHHDPEVQAIAHSGYSTDDVMLNPTQFGFVAAIKKPTPPSEIARALAHLIRQRGADGT